MSGHMIPLTEMKQATTCRVDSCLGEPQEEIVAALIDDNIRLFSDILADENAVIDVNKEYHEHNHSTLLYMAVAQGKLDFAERLLAVPEVQPNHAHRILKQFPVHAAAEQGNAKMLEMLLRCGADINAKMENGNTPLHIVAVRSNAKFAAAEDTTVVQLKFLQCAQLLLKAPNLNVDCQNNIGVTPAFFAAEKGSEAVTKAILERGGCVTTEVDGETVESLLQQRFPELLRIDLNRVSSDTLENQLFHMLYEETQNPGRFRKAWEEAEKNNNRVKANAHNGSYTFLQYCCDLGFHELVHFLLERGADPNLKSPNYQMPPVVLAAHHGYHLVLKVFKDWTIKRGLKVDFTAVDGIKRENALHKAIKRESKAYINYEHRSYDRCLQLLLDENPAFRRLIEPAVNAQDQLGNTPLHNAAQLGHEDTVRKLLRCEANIGIKNKRQETPIIHISPAVMEEFLDDCLLGDGLITDERFRITFKYSFLGPPLARAGEKEDPLLEEDDRSREQFRPDLPEAEPLWYMSQLPEHRQLLCHPVITSFLCMKWRRIRPYYYINLSFYLLFMSLLTAYAMLLNQSPEITKDPDATVVRDATDTSVLQHVTTVFLVILTIRELFQALVSFRRYIFSLENLLEISLIVITYVLFFASISNKTAQHLSAAAVLLSWAEMMMLLGRHPKLSTFITMFSTVSWNFFFFLAWFVPLIIAFAFAFFILLHKPEGTKDENGEDVNAYYVDPEKSVMKTVVMSLTGEIEFEGIEFNDNPFPRIIFLLYVFFIMLVLVNLLNGLAVSDITEIKKHAEIVGHVSRVELISYTESMLCGDPFEFFTNWPPFSWGRFLPAFNCFGRLYNSRALRKALDCLVGSRKFLLFSERLADKKAVFFPNKSAKERSVKKDEQRRRDKLILDAAILEAAKALVVKRQEGSDVAGIAARLQKVEKTLLLLAQQQNHIVEMLNTLSAQ